MRKLQGAWTLGMLALLLSGARAQDGASVPSGAAAETSSQPQQPVPAYGQDRTLPPIVENPPISGLDQPGLEPHAAPLSYLQPGATIAESADSNVSNTPGAGSVRSVSRVIGDVTLQRLWRNYDLALQYMGGAAYYNLRGVGWKQLQQLDLDQKITWKRGRLSLRDSASYLPEGNFGGAYGSQGSQGIASLGNSAFGGFWGGSTLGTLGLVPRLMNVSLADISENLTPKSAVTAAGGYALTHFYKIDPNSGVRYLGTGQASGQVAYNRILTSRTQVAMVYGYQAFDFSTVGNSFHSHLIELMYGHRVSGRMDFLIAAGPQITKISLCPVFVGSCLVPKVPDTRIGVAGRMRLRYQLARTSLDLTYERVETAGSGLFAGALTDVGTFRAERRLSREWNAFLDVGYARNSRAQAASGGINANTYNYGFAGAGLHRSLGRNFHAFMSYQFNQLLFDRSFCGTAGTPCSRISNRHEGTIGLDWTPRPIRID